MSGLQVEKRVDLVRIFVTSVKNCNNELLRLIREMEAIEKWFNIKKCVQERQVLEKNYGKHKVRN